MTIFMHVLIPIPHSFLTLCFWLSNCMSIQLFIQPMFASQVRRAAQVHRELAVLVRESLSSERIS